jgi:hypothetical protein
MLATSGPLIPALDDDDYDVDHDDDGCGAVSGTILVWETEVIGENVPECHFPHYKFSTTLLGIKPGPPW